MKDLKLVISNQNHEYKKTPPLGKLTLVASNGKIIAKTYTAQDAAEDAASIYAAIQEIRAQLENNSRILESARKQKINR